MDLCQVVALLKEHQALVSVKRYKHRYPYDWRTKQPVIQRATQQWFADLSHVKDLALASLEHVAVRKYQGVCLLARAHHVLQMVPKHGRARLESMLSTRNEWCISRQRAWGVPIPVFYDQVEVLLSWPSSYLHGQRNLESRCAVTKLLHT